MYVMKIKHSHTHPEYVHLLRSKFSSRLQTSWLTPRSRSVTDEFSGKVIISHKNEQSCDVDRQVIPTKRKCRLFIDISDALLHLLLLCGDIESNPGPVSVSLCMIMNNFVLYNVGNIYTGWPKKRNSRFFRTLL